MRISPSSVVQKYVVDSKIKANNNQTPYAKEFVRLYVQLKKENDSIEILLNKEMEKMNAVKKTKAGRRILKRI